MDLTLIDAHAHLQFTQYDKDREEVIARMREAGVGAINVGTDLKTSRQAVALAEANDDLWATIGIHPTDIPAPGEEEANFLELEKLSQHPRVVSVGECGLDFFHIKDENERKRQAEVFEWHVELAKRVNKPLMIHCRDAYSELLPILRRLQPVASNIHFFAGGWSVAKQFLDLGSTLSFTGVITFTGDYDEVIQNISLDRMLAETDCPFVAPKPFRGKRNEPTHVTYVANRLAELKGLEVPAMKDQLLANTRLSFGL